MAAGTEGPSGQKQAPGQDRMKKLLVTAYLSLYFLPALLATASELSGVVKALQGINAILVAEDFPALYPGAGF